MSLFAGLVLGWLSFRLIEPLGRREGFTLRLAPLLATAMAALAFYCTYRKPSVAPGDFVSSGWKGGAYDARFQPGFSGARLGADLPGLRADIALLGDSHALSLASELDAMMRQRALAGAVFASGGTRVINWRQTRYDLEPVARDRFERNRDEFLSRRQPRWVVLVARWETLDDPDALDAVDRLLSHVFSLSPDSQIVIVGQPPHFPYGDIKMHEWLNWRRRLGVEEPSLAMPPNPALHRVGAALSALAESRPGVHYLPVDDLFPSHDGRISPLEHGVLLYEDDDHLSDAGARKIVGILWPLLGPTLR